MRWRPGSKKRSDDLPISMDTHAERYVKLVLALGEHDPDYVDSYYGPPEWKSEAGRAKLPLAEMAVQADRLAAALGKPSANERGDEMLRLRHEYLRRQVEALRIRAG